MSIDIDMKRRVVFWTESEWLEFLPEDCRCIVKAEMDAIVETLGGAWRGGHVVRQQLVKACYWFSEGREAHWLLDVDEAWLSGNRLTKAIEVKRRVLEMLVTAGKSA